MDFSDIELLLEAPMPKQNECFEAAIGKLEDEDFLIIDEICKKLVSRMRYANIKQRIDYRDALELLAKLGIFLSLVDHKAKKGNEHG